MSATRKAYKQLGSLLTGFAAAAIVLAVILPPWAFNLFVTWWVGAFIGAVFSFFATAIVEMVSGELLKKYLVEITIFGFEFSFSLFFIATVIVRVWLFGI